MIDALSYQLDYLVPSQGTQVRTKTEKEGSMNWWLKNKMPTPTQSIYDKFFQDVKNS